MMKLKEIAAQNQSLEIFKNVLLLRAEVFSEWMKTNHPELTHMNEEDWDEQYTSWVEVICYE